MHLFFTSCPPSSCSSYFSTLYFLSKLTTTLVTSWSWIPFFFNYITRNRMRHQTQTCKNQVPWVLWNRTFSGLLPNLSDFHQILIFECENFKYLENIICIPITDVNLRENTMLILFKYHVQLSKGRKREHLGEMCDLHILPVISTLSYIPGCFSSPNPNPHIFRRDKIIVFVT